MNSQSFNLLNKKKWNEYLKKFSDIDFYFHPDYHDLYKLRYQDSEPYLWVYEEKKNIFFYPFNKSKINLDFLRGKNYFDINSTYGFVGPISNTKDKNFISNAWSEFDIWTKDQNIIVEFTRFNPLKNNHDICHNKTLLEFNRYVAISDFREGETKFNLSILSKTKNMIKKAKKNNFKTLKLNFKLFKSEFKNIYYKTMKRNKANSFFKYNSEYFDKIAKFKETEFYGIQHNNKLVAGGIFFNFNSIASYHLGACLNEYLRFGLSNLYLFDASIDLIKKGVKFMNLGGGRTTDPNDSLLKFKRDNSTELKKFFIGKRIINNEVYELILKNFKYKNNFKKNKLIFYRD